MLPPVRLFAIALLAAAVFATAANVPWSIEVAAIDGPVGYQLDRAPLWTPPPYEPFAEQLREDHRAHPWPDRWVHRGEAIRPPEVPDAATYAREVAVDWPGTLVHLVLLLWPAALLSGVMYLLVRGRRRTARARTDQRRAARRDARCVALAAAARKRGGYTAGSAHRPFSLTARPLPFAAPISRICTR